MRVVGGRLRGRRLVASLARAGTHDAPEGRDLRPTADRARQAIFNILEHGDVLSRPLEGARVLDAFAGTGALGIEALSRGAAHCAFIEREGTALAALAANLKSCGLGPGVAELLRADALDPPRARAPVDLVFLDPPYGENLAAPALMALVKQGWLAPGALAVVELGRRDDLAPPEGFTPVDLRRYGAARVVFIRFEEKF